MGTETEVLVIGATGYLGEYVTKASVAAGHPTFILVRPDAAPNPTKSALLDSFKEAGIKLLEGSFEDQESLVKALKQVTVVISTVGGSGLAQQFSLIPAIKEAGTIKRFLPSEFGLDVDRAPLLPTLAKYLSVKRDLRREIEKAGIPHTYVCNPLFFQAFLASLWQIGRTTPPKDKIDVYGDGEAKVSLVAESDVGAYTIKAVDDPRTLNKTFSVRPQLLSANEIIVLWEKKIGQTLEKTHLSNDDVIERIKAAAASPPPTLGVRASAPPLAGLLSLRHTAFLLGATGIPTAENYAEALDLYPDFKFVTVGDYLDQFV